MLFEADTGHVGLASYHILPGDRIVRFEGPRSLFILRKCVNSDERGPQMWQLLGECYMRDFMFDYYRG